MDSERVGGLGRSPQVKHHASSRAPSTRRQRRRRTEGPSLLAHGFTIKQMAELVRAGLATAHSERVVAGTGTPMEVARVKITEAERRALADARR
jgi:hypothetical protein